MSDITIIDLWLWIILVLVIACFLTLLDVGKKIDKLLEKVSGEEKTK